MMFARLGLPLSDASPNVPALTLAAHLMGGGGNSRLWKRIREKEGLSYGVGAGIGWSEDNPQSIWHLYAIFAPQNRAKVEDALRDETAHMLSDGFTEAEVKSGIQALLNQRRMAFDQRMDEAIAGLDAETVNAALRKYFKLDEFVMVFAGDFNQLAP